MKRSGTSLTLLADGSGVMPDKAARGKANVFRPAEVVRRQNSVKQLKGTSFPVDSLIAFAAQDIKTKAEPDVNIETPFVSHRWKALTCSLPFYLNTSPQASLKSCFNLPAATARHHIRFDGHPRNTTTVLQRSTRYHIPTSTGQHPARSAEATELSRRCTPRSNPMSSPVHRTNPLTSPQVKTIG